MDRKSVVLAQHLEVVTHILQCLGLIINTKMSLTQELEFLGMLVNTNTLLVNLPAYKVKEIRAEAIRISGLPLSSPALPLPGEAQHSNPGHSSNPTILLLPASSKQQQSGLRGSSVPITTLPRKTLLVERTPFHMEWEAPKGQVRSSYRHLRCLPTRLGAPVRRITRAVCGKFRNRQCTSTVWST